MSTAPSTFDDARQGLDPLRQLVERAYTLRRVRRRVRILHRDQDPRAHLLGKRLAQLLVDVARLDAPRQRAHVGRGDRQSEERRSEQQYESERRQQHQDGPSHHPGGDAVPHAVESGDPAHRQSPGVDARSERHQQRGKERQRRDDGQQHDDHATQSHRRDERSLEEQHGAEADRDRETREHDRMPGGVERRDEGVVAARTPFELVAVARHDEQRVVDRHAEPDQ